MTRQVVVYNRFPRMVRDLARKMAQEIGFVVEGKETELDRNGIEPRPLANRRLGASF